MTQTIETGTGEGFTLKVNSSGQAQTQGEVTNTVTTRRLSCEAHRTVATVTTTSDTLVSDTAGRCGLFIQNRSDDTVYLRFGPEDATTSDWKLPPGAEFKAEDFRYDGEITAISSGASSAVVVVEMVEP